MIADRKFRLLLLLFFLLTTATSAQLTVDRIRVRKKEHMLLLLSGEQVVRSYKVGLGGGGLAPKRHQGDRRTPEFPPATII